MRFSIDRANLVRACSHLAGVFAGRTTVPILNNVMIEVHDDKATFTGNNLSQSLSITVPAKVAKGGSTTVEYHRLKSIADASPEGSEIDLDHDDAGNATVRAGRGRYKLFTLPPLDFPVFEFPENLTAFTLHGAEFERLLAPGYAVTEDDKRSYLCGIYMHRKEKEQVLACVATDTHRLSYVEIPLPDDAEDVDDVDLILPVAAIKILKSMVSDDPATIKTDGRKFAVSFERGGMKILFATKLVDGTYPEYQRIIPARSDVSFVVRAEPMLRAIKRALIVQDERSASIDLSVSEGKVAISTKSKSGMEATDEVDCDWAGEPVEMRFNGRYLTDAISNMDEDEIEVVVYGPGMPVRIEVPGDEGRVDILAQQGR